MRERVPASHSSASPAPSRLFLLLQQSRNTRAVRGAETVQNGCARRRAGWRQPISRESFESQVPKRRVPFSTTIANYQQSRLTADALSTDFAAMPPRPAVFWIGPIGPSNDQTNPSLRTFETPSSAEPASQSGDRDERRTWPVLPGPACMNCDSSLLLPCVHASLRSRPTPRPGVARAAVDKWRS
jgi:hypothetical protein